MRQDWIDISKGFVILLMVLGHTTIPDSLARWVYSFHMPFFFFISGFCTSWNRDTFLSFFRRRMKTLLIPFGIYSCINFFLYPFALHVSPLDYIKGVLLYGWGGVALWFVPVLFCSVLLTKCLLGRFLFLFAVVCAGLGAFLDSCQVDIPWSVSSVPFATSLVMLGMLSKELVQKFVVHASMGGQMLLFFLGGGTGLLVSHFYRLDMAANHISPIFPISIGIVAGILFTISLSLFLSKVSLLSAMLARLGRHTFEMMAFSQVIIVWLNVYFPVNPLVKYIIMFATVFVIIRIRQLLSLTRFAF